MKMPNWLRYLCAGILIAAAVYLLWLWKPWFILPLILAVFIVLPPRRKVVTVSPPDEKLTILINRNVKMTPNKLAAQAIHAALYAYGIDHGRVIVLDASPTKLREQCDILVHDAGHTELEPGTLTAGVRRTERPKEAQHVSSDAR